MTKVHEFFFEFIPAEARRLYGREADDVIAVLCHQATGIHFGRAKEMDFAQLRDDGYSLLGAVMFSKQLVGSVLAPRMSPILYGAFGELDILIGNLLAKAGKAWLEIPEGTPAGTVPIVLRKEDCIVPLPRIFKPNW